MEGKRDDEVILLQQPTWLRNLSICAAAEETVIA